MKLTATGRKQEVGLHQQTLDPAVRRQLNIPLDKERLSASDLELLAKVRSEYFTGDVTPMNSKYGPISGMSEGERVLRAYRLGLLSPKATRCTGAGAPRTPGCPGGQPGERTA